VGDRVVAVTRGGAFASHAAVPAAACVVLPPGVTGTRLQDAAGLAVAFGTADVALTHYARLSKKDVVVVTGAGGGVGTAAVQLAAGAGATVIAVARGEDKAAALKRLGAAAVVDPSALAPDALPAALRAAAGGKPITILLDNVGGSVAEGCMRALGWGARILVVGFASGKPPRLPPPGVLLVKNQSVHGIFWGSHMQHAPRVLGGSLAKLVAALADGRLTVPVSHRLPLTAAGWGDAVAAMRGRSVVGKVLLVPGGGAAKL
jgi:sacsin